MKRAIAFLVLGPVLVLVSAIASLAVAPILGTQDREFAGIVATVLFFFTLPVAAVAGAFDAYLARAFAVALRAPLIAAFGAVIASGLAWLLFSWALPSSALQFFAIGGAACMGACSLLANDYGWRQSVVHANSLLRH
jgi:hypothetical protein